VLIDATVELLAFNVKLLGRKGRKNVLISAGKPSDKEKMFPAIEKLAALGVNIYATEGTSKFLKERGLENQEMFKITEKKEPNIQSFLEQDLFDLVINVLVGDHDYDESSDSRLIRTLSIENGIPLITDAGVAIQTIDQMVETFNQKTLRYRLEDPDRPWDLRSSFMQMVAERGGYACYHAHFDKAYLISRENLRLSQVDMQKKWDLYRYLQENYTLEDLIERISRGVEAMIAQGVTHCRTHVDASAVVGLLPIEAALQVRETYKDQITLQFGIQPLSGLRDPEDLAVVRKAIEMADIIGGLPSRDRPLPEKHLDILMGIAKETGKPLDIHVDQENNPDEHECELLAMKTIEHGLEGRVNAIHAISLAAQTDREQDRVAKLMADAGMSVTICPSAAISMKQLERTAPLHNSIAPLMKLREAGVPVRIGVDNIADLFMPLVDGDMWFEARLLMEATRFYELEAVADMITDKTGFGVPAQAKAA